MGLCVLADRFESLDEAFNYLDQYGNLSTVRNLDRPASRVKIFLGQVTRKYNPSEDGRRIVIFLKQVTRLGVENEDLRVVIAGPLVKALVDNNLDVDHLVALVNPIPFRCPDYQCLSVAPDMNVTWLFQNDKLITQLKSRSSASPAVGVLALPEETADESFTTVRNMDSFIEDEPADQNVPPEATAPSVDTACGQLKNKFKVKKVTVGPITPVTLRETASRSSGGNDRNAMGKVGDSQEVKQSENEPVVNGGAPKLRSHGPVTSTPNEQRRQKGDNKSSDSVELMESDPVDHCSSCSSAFSVRSCPRESPARSDSYSASSDDSIIMIYPLRRSNRNLPKSSTNHSRRSGLRKRARSEDHSKFFEGQPSKPTNFKKFAGSKVTSRAEVTPSSVPSLRSACVPKLPMELRSSNPSRPRQKKRLLRKKEFFPSSDDDSSGEGQKNVMTRRASLASEEKSFRSLRARRVDLTPIPVASSSRRGTDTSSISRSPRGFKIRKTSSRSKERFSSSTESSLSSKCESLSKDNRITRQNRNLGNNSRPDVSVVRCGSSLRDTDNKSRNLRPRK